MKEISCIYEIKNIINQHRYIGQTKNFYTRKRKHMNDLKKNKHKNDYLQNAWNKYGEKNFEFNIIEICDILDLDEKEIYWINYFNSFHNGYNLCEGGNGQICRELSEYSKSKISKANKGKFAGNKSPRYNQKLSKEERENLSKKMKEKKWINEKNPNSKKVIELYSKEVFECMKIAANKYNIDYRMIIRSCKNKCIVVDSIWMYYDEYTTYIEEDLQKIISDAEYKHNKGKKKSVICINTNEIFDSVKEASKKYNLDESFLSKCCRNKIKYCGKDSFGNKLHWSFIKE